MESRVERMIKLLVDEVEQRLSERRDRAAEPGRRASEAEREEALPASASVGRYARSSEVMKVSREAEKKPVADEPPVEKEPVAEPEAAIMPMGPPHAAKLMVRLALILVAILIVANIPFRGLASNWSLARALPDSAAWVLVDGFVVMEEDASEIYVYEDGKMRWISSMDAFRTYGYDWGDVHVAANGYLDRFEIGEPVYVLAKCGESPHVYLLQGETKRWIRDLETFTAEGYVWEDVMHLSCSVLRYMPDGETIPPGSGPPPQP